MASCVQCSQYIPYTKILLETLLTYTKILDVKLVCILNNDIFVEECKTYRDSTSQFIGIVQTQLHLTTTQKQILVNYLYQTYNLLNNLIRMQEWHRSALIQ